MRPPAPAFKPSAPKLLGPKLSGRVAASAALAACLLAAPPRAQEAPAFPMPEPPADAPAAEPPARSASAEDREADLLRQLREAESPEAAGLVESELAAIWSSSGSPVVDLLLRRGTDALEAGDAGAAVEHLTAAIDHAPAFAEAYAARAAAYYLTNSIGPALDDLREALVLNPHHWEAMGGFAVLLEEMGRPADALEVWRRAADINPQSAPARSAVDRLAIEVEGHAI